MTNENSKLIEENETIVLLPMYNKNILKILNKLYKNSVIVIDEKVDEISSYIEVISNSNVKKVVFVNFITSFSKMYENIRGKVIESIFTYDLASLTDEYLNIIFNNIIDYYNRGIIKKIYCSNNDSFEVLKKSKYNVDTINLVDKKVPTLSNKNKNSIGILCTDYDPKHNFYNALTSIRLVDDYDKVKMISHMNATVEFFNYFDIKHEFCDNIDEVMKDNYVNIYCCFTNYDVSLIIKSMNMGIPCIVGNCDIFDNNKVLKELLVLKSDDDVNEIADKINKIKINYDKIFEEYKKANCL